MFVDAAHEIGKTEFQHQSFRAIVRLDLSKNSNNKRNGTGGGFSPYVCAYNTHTHTHKQTNKHIYI